MYREISNGVQIDVTPAFVPEESIPDASYYFFSYTIRIKNVSEVPAQLLSRHWIITDGKGAMRQVQGEGVIGKQPKLEPGESFEYTSFCPLPTPTGNMRGSYYMVNDRGEKFEVRIPLFFLRDTRSLH